jgi:hypothetical protein
LENRKKICLIFNDAILITVLFVIYYIIIINGIVAGGSVGGLILLSLILIAVWKIRVYQRKLRSVIKGHWHEMEIFFFDTGG